MYAKHAVNRMTETNHMGVKKNHCSRVNKIYLYVPKLIRTHIRVGKNDDDSTFFFKKIPCNIACMVVFFLYFLKFVSVCYIFVRIFLCSVICVQIF